MEQAESSCPGGRRVGFSVSRGSEGAERMRQQLSVSGWKGHGLGRDIVAVPRLVLVVVVDVGVALFLLVVPVLFVLELAPPWLETRYRNVPGVVSVIWRRVSRTE